MATVYLAYLLVSVVLIIVVAGTLFHNGRAFLIDCFGNVVVADAVNRLLVVGFIVTKIAWAAVFVTRGGAAAATLDKILLLFEKIGLVALVLGGMHLCNLVALSAFRAHRIRIQRKGSVA